MCNTFLSELRGEELKELLYDCIEELSISNANELIPHAQNVQTFHEIETIINHIKNRCLISIPSNNQNEELLINMPWGLIQSCLHNLIMRTPPITELIDVYKNAPTKLLYNPLIDGKITPQFVEYFLKQTNTQPVINQQKCA